MLLAFPSFASEVCAALVAALIAGPFRRVKRLYIHTHDAEHEIARITARIRGRANRPYLLRMPRFLLRWMSRV